MVTLEKLPGDRHTSIEPETSPPVKRTMWVPAILGRKERLNCDRPLASPLAFEPGNASPLREAPGLAAERMSAARPIAVVVALTLALAIGMGLALSRPTSAPSSPPRDAGGGA